MDNKEYRTQLHHGIQQQLASHRQWWHGRTSFQKFFPATFAFSYLIFLAYMDDLKLSICIAACLALLLAYSGRGPRKVISFFLPLILTAIVYESQRYWGEGLRARIRVSEPYNFDLQYFGINTPSGVLTPNQWWELNTHWILDLVAGFGYIAFIPIFLSIAGAFVFYFSKHGTRKFPALRIALESPKVMWSFFWVNMLGYSTYYWYPAAPPWYAKLYGFGAVKLDAPPSPAGAARFDELLGIQLFENWYGGSANVFGAIPSLHIAYPLVAVYFAFKFGELRKTAISYYILLCFGAVYLNHHYVIDLIWGSAYAISVSWMVDCLPQYFTANNRQTEALAS